jgi:TRAP-type C4-dicarboxylate transport system permease small subunit
LADERAGLRERFPAVDAYVRFVGRLMDWIRVVIGILLLICVALNLANVFGRYALHAPLVGAEEVILFLLVTIVFLSFPRVMWEGKHIKMDILVSQLPPKWKHVTEVIVALVSIAIGVIIINLAVPVISHLAMFNERSEAANVPLAIPQAMIPIGYALMILVAIARLLDPAKPESEDVNYIDERAGITEP